jgi:hypothetical protein
MKEAMISILWLEFELSSIPIRQRSAMVRAQ